MVPIWRELAEMAYLWQVPHRLDGSSMEPLVPPAATAIDAALRASLRTLGHGQTVAAPTSATESQ